MKFLKLFIFVLVGFFRVSTSPAQSIPDNSTLLEDTEPIVRTKRITTSGLGLILTMIPGWTILGLNLEGFAPDSKVSGVMGGLFAKIKDESSEVVLFGVGGQLRLYPFSRRHRWFYLGGGLGMAGGTVLHQDPETFIFVEKGVSVGAGVGLLIEIGRSVTDIYLSLPPDIGIGINF